MGLGWYRFKKVVGRCAILWLSLFFLGCSIDELKWSTDSSTISGRVFPTGIDLKQVGQKQNVCAVGRATVYQMDEDGNVAHHPLGQTSVDEAGNYSISIDESLGRSGKKDISSLFVKVDMCGLQLSRPVTNFKNQDLFPGSTLVGYLLTTSQKKVVADQIKSNSGKVEALLNDLRGASSVEEAYLSLQAEERIRNSFVNLVGVSPAVLEIAAPNVKHLVLAETGDELQAISLSVEAEHWRSDYRIAYKWIIDDVVVSANSSLSYTPHANSQGKRQVKLILGNKGDDGGLDLTKPHQVISRDLVIADSMPAVPPRIGLVTSSPTSELAIDVAIETGPDLTACRSFSSLALTVNNDKAPTDPGLYNISCLEGNSQRISTVLPAGDGIKTLRLWARDSAGNISKQPSTTSITLEQNPPTVIFQSLPVLVKGGQDYPVLFTAEDLGSGMSQAILEFSLGGTDFTELAIFEAHSTPTYNHLWRVPATDSDSVHLRVRAVDLAGNSTSAQTPAFEVDATPPALSLLSLNSGTYRGGSSQSIIWSSADKNLASHPITIEYTSNNGSTWTPIVSSYENIGSFDWTLPLLNSNAMKVRVRSLDLAGNEAIAESTTSFSVDSAAPSFPSITRTSPQYTSAALVTLGISSCADVAKILINESLLQPHREDGAWLPCSSSASYSVVGEGTHNLQVWLQDAVGNVTPVSSSVSMILDTTTPQVSLLTMNSGSWKGGATEFMNWSATDSYLAANPVLLSYSQDGGLSWSEIASNLGNSGTYSLTIPTINSIEFRVRVQVRDLAGNISEAVSAEDLTVDSEAPPQLLLSNIMGDPTGTRGLQIGLDACSGDAVKMIVKESSATPLLSDSGWEVCSSVKAFELSAGDGAKVIYAWSRDSVGNISAVSSLAVTLDTTPPSVQLQDIQNQNKAGGSVLVLAWAVSDLHLNSDSVNLEYSADNGVSWNSIAAGLGANAAQSCVPQSGFTGCYNWTLPVLNSQNVVVRLTGKDSLLNQSMIQSGSFVIDSQAPVLASVSINDGQEYAGSPLVNLKINLIDNFAGPYYLRFSETTDAGQCQSLYADSGWLEWSGADAAIPFSMSPVDALKKICVWGKDKAGNVSVISPSECTVGIDCDTIFYQTGNPPVITSLSLSLTNGGTTVAAGDPLTITWAVTDVEGLKSSPISFSYTTNNSTWKDIFTNQDASVSENVTWIGSFAENATSADGTITSWTAPSSGFLRVRALARDQAGNQSIAAFSEGLGLQRWSFFAGASDNGDGGTAASATLNNNSYGNSNLAIDPVRGDIYVRDYATNRIRRLDVKTGIINTFSYSATTNLSAVGGALPASISIHAPNSMAFDRKGFFYVQDSSLNVYQIDLVTKTSRQYIKRGTLYNASATWENISISDGTKMSFDEDNAMYFFAECIAEMVANDVRPKKIVKLSQNPNGTPGTLSMVAGNCTKGNPVAGTPALDSPINTDQYTGLTATLVALDRGNTIYFAHYGSANYFKIVDGIIYNTTLTCAGYKHITYNPNDQMLYYKSASGGVAKANVSRTGNGGETSTIIASSTYAPGCKKDDISASSACISNLAMTLDKSGTVYVSDGPGGSGNNRIRYIDASGKVRTIIGALAFYGDGKHRLLARGMFRGIYYKQPSEPNQAAFPAGLYFVDSNAMVLGYVHPVTGIVEILWGDQARMNYPNTGTDISKDLDMGPTHSQGAGFALAFDENGLPWLRSGYIGYRVDENRKVVRLQNVSQAYVEDAAEGSAPSLTSMNYFGGLANLALKGMGMFVFGGYQLTNHDPVGKIQYLDFGSNKVTRVIGGTEVLMSQNPTTTADILVPGGGVQNATLPKVCYTGHECYLQYRRDQDRLYFSENNMLRYISKPDRPTESTLVTLFSLPSEQLIRNFIFTLDGSQIWYFRENNGLYCRDISSGKSWCDGTTDYNTMKNIVGDFRARTNGMTWIDSGNLLISPGNGSIYKFTLPTGP